MQKCAHCSRSFADEGAASHAAVAHHLLSKPFIDRTHAVTPAQLIERETTLLHLLNTEKFDAPSPSSDSVASPSSGEVAGKEDAGDGSDSQLRSKGMLLSQSWKERRLLSPSSVCLSCLEILLDTIAIELETTHAENQSLQLTLQSPLPSSASSSTSPASLDDSTLLDETEVFSAFSALVAEESALRSSLVPLRALANSAEEEERLLLSEYANLASKESDLQDERAFLSTAISEHGGAAQLLQYFARPSLFEILTYLDPPSAPPLPLPSINGVRVGKLSTSEPDWREVNAGLGQVLSAVASIANTLTKFGDRAWMPDIIARTRLIRKGSTSALVVRGSGPQGKEEDPLPLYHREEKLGWIVPKFIKRQSFSIALERLLAYVGALFTFASRQEPPLMPDPYAANIRISDNQIGILSPKVRYYSIRYEDTSYADWTEAMRLLLNRVQRLLVWLDTFEQQHSAS